MKLGARVTKVEYFLPERVVSNGDLESEFDGWKAVKVEKKTGIRERRVAGEGETALDLGLKAAQKTLKDFDRSQIDFLFFCTQSPDYFLPTSACILQDKLNLGQHIGAMDFNLGCSGFVYGLSLAKGLIAAGVAKNILLVTAETYNKHIHPKDKGNRTIFGDGAAAAIIQESEEPGILEFSLGTDGSGYDQLIVPNGGLRNPYDPRAQEVTDKSGNVRSQNNLYMNGPEIFNFTIKAVPQIFEETLAKNGLTLDELDYVIFHQANLYMIEYLRKKIQIPEEKFYKNMLLTGNTVSSTIPIALKEALNEGLVKKGYKVMLLGFGVGYSWAGTIINI